MSSERSVSLTEIIVGASLSMALGLFASFAYLALQPVEILREAPEEGQFRSSSEYFVEGQALGQYRNQWESLLNQIQEVVQGGNLDVTIREDDLNHWATANFVAPDEEVERPFLGGVFPKNLNFRVDDENIQVGVDMDYDGLGLRHVFKLKVIGELSDRRGQNQFSVNEVYLGQCRIPGAFGLRNFFLNRVRESYPVPPVIPNILREADVFEVHEGEIRLVVGS
ncbi:MAG: hypothetical protein JJT75_04935 [Opitutales bacterium]|nr:hypothetical protein [Opitutales bacterium]MCH8540563.1 hypothetical protein [Opitutales bacterium]